MLNVGKTPATIQFNAGDVPFRTADGRFNDPLNEVTGGEGTFFGRNMLPVDQKNMVTWSQQLSYYVNYIIYKI